MTKSSWNDVFKLNIYEFFNLVAYDKDKKEMEKYELEKFKKK